MERYLVGGYVRDNILGVPSKDIDYTVVVPNTSSVDEAWDTMLEGLREEGFEVFLESPQYQTVRAKFPKGHEYSGVTADFVLARKEGPYSDNRHPDWVAPGTLYDDLARRDFTVNAIAQAEDGSLIDPFGGVGDLSVKRLRAVGNAKDRLREDPLRAFRALRFSVTKGFKIDYELANAMLTVSVLDGLRATSSERIREELVKMFKADTIGSMRALVVDYPAMGRVVEDRGIWFQPTVGKRK